MKKKISILLFVLLIVFLIGCSANTENINDTSVDMSETKQRETAESEVVSGKEKYFVKFECKQSHFTLDIKQHIKDSMNAITFEVMVDEDYYNEVDIGTVINDDFKVGSFVMSSSIGSWNISVVDKSVR